MLPIAIVNIEKTQGRSPVVVPLATLIRGVRGVVGWCVRTTAFNRPSAITAIASISHTTHAPVAASKPNDGDPNACQDPTV